ncbi:hypothetical protein [Neptunicoccus cionae]|uniref:Uncharacterized protein n=1 Tax=Neptunicoccus cionae TaxID=2035344 RepID=A0A916QVN1_9RHOB|nr:hypothetical protein [Amylibacter cionae]GGA14414.1 hypothetical protein GCM10011498_13270 [Amylibacter cionae]
MTEDRKTFQKRVARVDPDFKPTLWRKWLQRPRRKVHIPLARTALCMAMFYGTVTVTKVVMIQELGPQGYEAKVAQLASGTDGSKIAAKLLGRDPVLAYVESNFL